MLLGVVRVRLFEYVGFFLFCLGFGVTIRDNRIEFFLWKDGFLLGCFGGLCVNGGFG